VGLSYVLSNAQKVLCVAEATGKGYSVTGMLVDPTVSWPLNLSSRMNCIGVS